MPTTVIVEHVDRINRQIKFQGVGEGPDRPEGTAKYRGDPPWPLSYVDLTQIASGVWRCEGPLGNREPILHDDFTYLLATATEVDADTRWRVRNPSAAGTAGLDNLASRAGHGSWLVLTSGATAGQYINIAKAAENAWDPGPAQPTTAIWYRALVTGSGIANKIVQVGLANDAGDGFNFGAAGASFVGLVSDSTLANNRWQLRAIANAVDLGSVDTGVIVQQFSGYFLIELVIVRGAWAAAWITALDAAAGALVQGGRGPFVAGPFILESTSIPPSDGANSAVHPVLGVDPLDNNPHGIEVDWIDVDMVSGIAHPGRDLILPSSQIVGAV